MEHEPMYVGKLFVVSAASGTGKTSLVRALLQKDPQLTLSTSYTTRSPRPSEEDGNHYFFVSEDQFISMQSNGDFLESAKVFSNYYGTSKQWVLNKLQQGEDLLLEIDWQGALQLRKTLNEHTILIFILPPSLETLEKRLCNRGEDDEAIIRKRLLASRQEITMSQYYDYLVINDQFDHALQDLMSIIAAQRLKIDRQLLAQHDLITNLIQSTN